MLEKLYAKAMATLSAIFDILEKRRILEKLMFSKDRPLVLSSYLFLAALVGTFMPYDSPLIVLRWITLIPYFFIVPGYSIVRIVYPKGLEPEERFGMSLITSLAIMPLAGLSLLLGEMALTVAVSITGLISIGLQLAAIREKTMKSAEEEAK